MTVQMLQTASCALLAVIYAKLDNSLQFPHFVASAKQGAKKPSKKVFLVMLISFTYFSCFQLVLVILDTQLLVLLTLTISPLIPINKTTL